MALDRKIFLPKATEQNVLFGAQRLDPETEFNVLKATDRSRIVGGYIVNIANTMLSAEQFGQITSGMKTSFEADAPEVGNKGSGNKVKNVGELGKFVESLKIETPFKIKCRDVLYDWTDGAAMAAQLRIIRGDADLAKALEDSDFFKADAMLSGGDNGGVLKGVSEIIVDSVITDRRLLDVLQALDGELTKAWRYDPEKSAEIGHNLRFLYTTDVPSNQVNRVEQYYLWALEDAGVVTMGTGLGLENRSVGSNIHPTDEEPRVDKRTVGEGANQRVILGNMW